MENPKAILYFFAIAILCVVIYQDYRARLVHIILFPLIALPFILLNHFITTKATYWEEIMINFAFLISVFFLLYLLYALKNRRFTKIINSKIGPGDILILSSLCFYGNSIVYSRLFILSMIFSLILTGVFLSRKKNINFKTYKIPLAAHISIIWVLLLSFEIVFGNHLTTLIEL